LTRSPGTILIGPSAARRISSSSPPTLCPFDRGACLMSFAILQSQVEKVSGKSGIDFRVTNVTDPENKL